MTHTNRWYTESVRILRALDLQRDDPEARRKIQDAYPFGQRSHWPYKEWLHAVHAVYPWTRPKPKCPPLPLWLQSKTEGK